MKKAISISSVVLFALVVIFSFSIPAYAQYYIHDPMDNPKAAADIIVDPNAVYGYAPNPESARLGTFADYDWSNEAVVAQMKQEREEYHESIKELYQIKADLEAQGKSVEEIARAVSTRRNEIRMEAYKDDPEGLQKLKESNLAAFGNENGGTPDYFFEKYGSWETVIEKAFSTNAGADACLGLYDKYYDTYMIDKDNGEGSDDPQSPTQESTDTAGTENTETQAPTAHGDAVPEKDQTAKSPQTGDKAAPIIWSILIAAGVAAVCVTALQKHRES